MFLSFFLFDWPDYEESKIIKFNLINIAETLINRIFVSFLKDFNVQTRPLHYTIGLCDGFRTYRFILIEVFISIKLPKSNFRVQIRLLCIILIRNHLNVCGQIYPKPIVMYVHVRNWPLSSLSMALLFRPKNFFVRH